MHHFSSGVLLTKNSVIINTLVVLIIKNHRGVVC